MLPPSAPQWSDESSIGELIVFLEQTVKDRLINYIELPRSKTTEGLHNALTRIQLLKIWDGEAKHFPAFFSDLQKLKTLTTLIRKLPNENRFAARAKRRSVSMAVRRLNLLAVNRGRELLTTVATLESRGRP